MLTISAILVALLCTGVQAYFTVQDVNNRTFTFYSKSLDSSNALLCISGAVDKNEYISIGIPPPDEIIPFMFGSDLSIVYYSSKHSSIQLVHGRGMAIERPIFDSDKDSNRTTKQTLVKSESSYKNGVLKACIKRKMNVTSQDGQNLRKGVSSYLWASGSVLSEAPQYHAFNRGAVVNVTLFGLPPTTGKSKTTTKTHTSTFVESKKTTTTASRTVQRPKTKTTAKPKPKPTKSKTFTTSIKVMLPA
ncbi:hypothetical protein BCR33DRAFT_766649 [Rhizoclosmatium globosum]|uniref:DOMON domain-containing protein n=1 Tax=Rhizoclosmatium globosum TaxID=329046 RepID=A0A1Y2C8W5_9FUNG|nr:hypothetical protein BCR33DRAFT_766649 [Rhizoclosmatium globosum]|eukprot:ORY43470.1 hypothetical protein BCR33DRAFT_766649 [Rhizoclosmatium globosum]